MRALFLSVLIVIGAKAHADPMVFAAASTSRAVDAAIAASGIEAVTSYSASGTIARQIERGAPADLFISANPRWMAPLVERGIVDAGAVVPLMSNALVLIAAEGSPPVDLDAGFSEQLATGTFAMADPEMAPVGRYGQEALETLGLWADVAPALVPTRNTLATVTAVQRGEADLGLTYASDIRDLVGVEIVAVLPPESHDPIQYLAAPLADGFDPDGAAALLAFLTTTEGQVILAEHGFLPIGAGS